MRAVTLSAGQLSFDSLSAKPDAADGEVLVRVLVAGICETDVQLVRGYMNFEGIPGHEFVGIAETGRYAGQRVVAEINCSCHVCPTCRAGLANHCPHRSVIGILNRNGAFADYVSVPERNLHQIPDNVSNEQAVFVEPLAAAFQIPAQVPELAGRRTVLLGDGRLAQLCASVSTLAGADVHVVGKHSEKLQRLKRLGISASIRGERTPDRQAEIVIDCTGSPSGLADAYAWLRPRGVLILKTTVAGVPATSLAPIVIDEFQVVGSRCGPFPPAIEALANGTIEVDSLITARYPLNDALSAFELVQSGPALKVLLNVSE